MRVSDFECADQICQIYIYLIKITIRIVAITIRNEYKLRDLKLYFSFLQNINDTIGIVNVNTITGSHRISKIIPVKTK